MTTTTKLCLGLREQSSQSINRVYAKSLYSSCAESHFCGPEYEIWADFGPVGKTEKENWANYEQLLRTVFSCFMGKKNVYNFF